MRRNYLTNNLNVSLLTVFMDGEHGWGREELNAGVG